MNEITVIDHRLLTTYSVVTNEVGEEQAVALRGKIKKRIAELDKELEPANNQIRSIKLQYKSQIDEKKTLKIADKVIENACKKYRIWQKQQIIKKKNELTVAQVKEDFIKQSPVPVTVIESVPNPEKIVRTTEGSMSYTNSKKCFLFDYRQIPVFFKGQQILFADMKIVNKLVLEQNEQIPGIEVHEDIGTRMMK